MTDSLVESYFRANSIHHQINRKMIGNLWKLNEIHAWYFFVINKEQNFLFLSHQSSDMKNMCLPYMTSFLLASCCFTYVDKIEGFFAQYFMSKLHEEGIINCFKQKFNWQSSINSCIINWWHDTNLIACW